MPDFIMPLLNFISTASVAILAAGLSYVAGKGMKRQEWDLAARREKVAVRQRQFLCSFSLTVAPLSCSRRLSPAQFAGREVELLDRWPALSPSIGLPKRGRELLGIWIGNLFPLLLRHLDGVQRFDAKAGKD